MNPLTIYLANLTHFRIGHISTETMPLNIGFLASYLLKVFGEKIAVSLFKYPPKLEASIRNAAPDVLCLSNYAWNSNLNYHYASYFKSAYPDITTIMGGPHYPGRPDRQEGFLRIHDKLDFYIFGEGELALAELINTLLNDRLNNEHLSVKEKIISIKGVHYIHKNTFVNNDKCERITDINLIPSPYLTNLLDEMLSENITPIIQTNRGCPFSCVYCHSSSEYFNSIRKFSLDRVKNEINYIMTKTTTDMIFIADDNFGIFEQDIEIQNYLIQCHKEHGWPNIAILSSAKQNKRTLEIALMLKKLRPFTVSLQSLNPATLKEIKRTNFTLEEYSAPLSELSKENGNSLGELILCLPQETETSFLESTKQLLNIGVREFEIYSCMLLPNTPLAEDSYYDRFQLRRMYRVLPRNFGDYLGKKIIEVEEIVVASNTMTFEQYLSLRVFSFIISTYLVHGAFYELFRYCKEKGFKRYDILHDIYIYFKRSNSGKTDEIYKRFLNDAKSELWENPKNLFEYYEKDENFSKLSCGKKGANLLQQYNAITIACLDDFVSLIEETLIKKGCCPSIMNDLSVFVKCQRNNIFTVDQPFQREFTFDIPEWLNSKTNIHNHKKRITLEFYHTKKQQNLIQEKQALYGYNDDAKGKILNRIPSHELFRSYKYVTENRS